MPTGGPKDITAPKLNSTERINYGDDIKIIFKFDERIQSNNLDANFYLSPPILNKIEKKIKDKSLSILIKEKIDSNITYHISLNNCIKDLTEGNVLDSLNFLLSNSQFKDSMVLEGKVQDAYSIKEIPNAWVLLYEEGRNDSVILKEQPNYCSKTNSNGIFFFNNLKPKKYKIVALTGDDFIFSKLEKIAFKNEAVSVKKDSIITLNAFKENVILNNDSSEINRDKVTTSLFRDSLNNNSVIITNLNKSNLIFELINENNEMQAYFFEKEPYIIKNIKSGEYELRYILDENRDGKWTSGSWDTKKQTEKVVPYYKKIVIRSNWDLEVNWSVK